MTAEKPDKIVIEDWIGETQTNDQGVTCTYTHSEKFEIPPSEFLNKIVEVTVHKFRVLE